MDGNDQNMVYCCFCGWPLEYSKAVTLVLGSKEMGEERQTLFADKKCLVKVINPSVPLHPDLLGPDSSEGDSDAS